MMISGDAAKMKTGKAKTEYVSEGKFKHHFLVFSGSG